jgi:hypothetical protein
MEPGPVEDQLALGFFVGSQKSCGGKDSPETLHNAAVPFAVLEEVKEVELLGGSAESHNPAALAKGLGCDPDWDEPVLTVGHSEPRTGDDLKGEFAVYAEVG